MDHHTPKHDLNRERHPYLSILCCEKMTSRLNRGGLFRVSGWKKVHDIVCGHIDTPDWVNNWTNLSMTANRCDTAFGGVKPENEESVIYSAFAILSIVRLLTLAVSVAALFVLKFCTPKLSPFAPKM